MMGEEVGGGDGPSEMHLRFGRSRRINAFVAGLFWVSLLLVSWEQVEEEDEEDGAEAKKVEEEEENVRLLAVVVAATLG